MKGPQSLIFELSSPGRTAVSLPAPEVPAPSLASLLPAQV